QSPLPRKVALLDALILLHCVGDEMLAVARISGTDGLGYMRKLVDSRNRSVLAHGDDSATAGQCQPLHGRALVNLRAFSGLHGPGRNVAGWIDTLRFVDEV